MRGPHSLGEICITQPLVAISSGESEFYALCRGTIELLFLVQLICWFEKKKKLQKTPELCGDATAALGAASRIGAGKRMKHIEMQHYFLQEHIQKREFVAKKAKGADNPADAGTKNLTEQKMNRMLNMIGAKMKVNTSAR